MVHLPGRRGRPCGSPATQEGPRPARRRLGKLAPNLFKTRTQRVVEVDEMTLMWMSRMAWGEERGAAATARRGRRRGRRSRSRQELEIQEEELKKEETRRSSNRRKELESETNRPQQHHSKENNKQRGEGGMQPRTPSHHTADRGVRVTRPPPRGGGAGRPAGGFTGGGGGGGGGGGEG